MVDGPTIANNDRAGLREFADRARTLYETLSSINALDEMNMTNIAQMSRKLAITHQVKWRENVQRIREQKRNPNLLDLVEFIERRAEVVNDPIFGRVGEAQRPPTFPLKSAGLKTRKETNNPADKDSFNVKQVDGVPKDSVSVSAATSHDSHKRSSTARIKTALQVLPVRVYGESGESIETHALLDTGSEESFLTRSLAEKLNLKEKSFDTLTVCTLAGESTVNVGRTGVTVEPLENPEHRKVKIEDIRIVEILNVKPFKPSDLSRWPHLSGISIPEIDEVTVLIGANIPEVQVHEESRTGRIGEPYAVRTILGWAILGPVGLKENDEWGRTNVHFMKYREEHLEQQLQQLLDLDNVGIGNSGSKTMSQDDRQALKILDKTVCMVNGHYEVGMLWKSEETWLPDNRNMAAAQLRTLRRKLDKNAELRGKYKAFVDDYLEKGYARKLTVEETAGRTNKTWYLPHHGVFHPKKPGKIRVVFNAAALHDGVSLNNQLYQGPDLTNSLVGVLLRFRQERIAIVADITAMFHQVKVPPKDSDSLRFLWWDYKDLEGTPEEYQMTSHIFVATDSPCCANYCLKRTAEGNKAEFSEEAVNTVKKDCSRLLERSLKVFKQGKFSV
jgi:hypothetical protein